MHLPRERLRRALADGAHALIGAGVDDAAVALPDAMALAEARATARRLLATGEPILALDMVDAAVARWPTDLALLQLRALALAKSGALERAAELLRTLLDAGHRDGETLGLLGGRLKELAEREPPGRARERVRREALDAYGEAYRNACAAGVAEAACFAGINVASLAWLGGDCARGERLAREVAALCARSLDAVSAPGGERDAASQSYWLRATLGEAALLLGDTARAREEYTVAGALARTDRRFADLASTRRQARRLVEQGADASVLDCLCLPAVVAFTGHMLDAPARARPRFPAACEATVRRGIERELRACDAGFGYASAASGGDILFLEAMLARGGEIHVVLPFPPADFQRVSVDVAGEAWGTRFASVLARASAIKVLCPSLAADATAAYEYTNLTFSGMADLRAARLDTGLCGVAVWDGGAGGRGGAGSLVQHWQRRGLPVRIVPPLASVAVACDTHAAPDDACDRALDGEGAREQTLMAILFADAVGYSKLGERQIPTFVERYLGAVAALLDASPRPPECRNTWGDALYFVFETVDAAAHFALDMRERLAAIDWPACGLPADLSLRIALHAGPVFPMRDPVTGARGYSGAHVSRAARIEPVTPPGEVYASEPFAAIAAATGVVGVTFEYVGQTSFAKGYGIFPVYHVRRHAKTERTRTERVCSTAPPRGDACTSPRGA
jgi:tetratricopeptide (TPR) repeat protein